MNEVFFSVPTQIWFASGASALIGREAAVYGKRILLISETLLDETIQGVSKTLQKAGIEPIIVLETVDGPQSDHISRVSRIARGAKAQAVIGLGGQDTLNFARGVALCAGEETDPHRIIDGEVVPEKFLPLMEIPTSFRDTFMCSDWIMMYDSRNGTSSSVRIKGFHAASLFLDPDLCSSVGDRYKDSIVSEILLTSFEGYLSRTTSFITDTFLLKAFNLGVSIQKPIRQEPENPEYLNQLCRAALFCAMGMVSAVPGAGYALAHTLRSRFDLPKAWCAATLMPHVLEMSLGAQPDRIARMAGILGIGDKADSTADAAEMVIEIIRQRVLPKDEPLRLRNIGLKVEEDDLVYLSKAASSLGFLRNVTVPFGEDDFLQLLHQAY